MVSSHGLLHVNLNVSDIECSVEFYTQAMGFQVVLAFEEVVDIGQGPETMRQVILTVPDTRTLFALTHAPSQQIGSRGLNHLGLVLMSDESVAEITQRVTNLGGSIQSNGTREWAGVSEAFAYIRDPDGYAIEISTQAILYAQLADQDTAADI